MHEHGSAMMAALIEGLLGRWAGRKCLYLSWLPNPEHWSDSTLRVTGVVNDHTLELSYDWSYEDQPRRGLLLLALNPDSSQASAAWIDSWHQSNALLQMQGQYAEDSVDLSGHYPVSGQPDWGWRIHLQRGAEDLHVRMYNRSPEGVETLGVHLQWHRYDD
jgi:hypothetical protein